MFPPFFLIPSIWTLVILALVFPRRHYFYLLFYFFGLPFLNGSSMERFSASHFPAAMSKLSWSFSSCNGAKWFHTKILKHDQCQENMNSWWTLLNLDSICFYKPLTQVTYSCPLYHGSWLPKLLQTHGNSACHHQKSQTLEKTWHPFDTVHAMLKRLSSKHTKHVLRQERVVWQPSKFDEVNLDAHYTSGKCNAM